MLHFSVGDLHAPKSAYTSARRHMLRLLISYCSEQVKTKLLRNLVDHLPLSGTSISCGPTPAWTTVINTANSLMIARSSHHF